MEVKMPKKTSKHLFVIRIITGAAFLFFGVFHMLHPENFEALLRITEIPLVSFNSNFIRLVDCLIGIFLLIGFQTRLTSAIGCLSSALIIWLSISIMQMSVADLPDGLTQKPFHPPVFVLIIVFIFSFYLLLFGGGRWSLDKRGKK